MSAVLPPCPANWEYEDVPGYSGKLLACAKSLLIQIRRADAHANLQAALDTRQIHGFCFVGLTPPSFDYYAGNYRGTIGLRCLDVYEVGIASDPRVGYPASTVDQSMAAFGLSVIEAMRLIDYYAGLNDPNSNPTLRLVNLVGIAAALFVEFLAIHPYANGNGHMARLFLLCVLARQGIYPSRGWRIDPKPNPPYSSLIKRYRDGDHDPLIRFILQAL